MSLACSIFLVAVTLLSIVIPALEYTKGGKGHLADALSQSPQSSYKEIASASLPLSKQNNISDASKPSTQNINSSSITSSVHQVAKKCLDVMFDE